MRKLLVLFFVFASIVFSFCQVEARMYEPETGMFLSEDPIGFAGGDVNLYRYVRNNPVSFADPFGLDPLVPSFLSDLYPGLNFSDPPGELNSTLQCHVNPHRDQIENLKCAGILVGGLCVLAIPSAIAATPQAVKAAAPYTAPLVSYLATHPTVVSNAGDFILGFTPNPPNTSPYGYLGSAINAFIKDLVPIYRQISRIRQ